MPTNNRYTRFAMGAARFSGRPAVFLLALLVILVWVVTGPLFDFSDTWQLVINTGTTIVTFLMVFLIQNSQNRDTEALHIKLDELELDRFRAKYEALAEAARRKQGERVGDADPPKG